MSEVETRVIEGFVEFVICKTIILKVMKLINRVILFLMACFMLQSCGKNGIDGNANVETFVIEVTPSQWKGDANMRTATIDMPELTKEVCDNGAVVVYNHPDANSTEWQALPYTWPGDDGILIRFMYEEGKVHINLTSNQNNIPEITSSYDYKIVIITSDKDPVL